MKHPKIETRPMDRIGHQKALCWMLILFVGAGLSAAREWFVETPPKIRVTAAADVEPPNRCGSGVGLRLGRRSGLSTPMCNVEMEITSCKKYLFRPVPNIEAEPKIE